jgi:hypothetical protein
MCVCQDNDKLTIMLQVHKQTNMDMQQAISEAQSSGTNQRD